MWWHAVTHGRGSEGETGECSGQPVPFTLTQNMVYPALLPLMRTPRLPVVDWTDAPADLNRLVRLAERRNLVSARVPSHFNWPLQLLIFYTVAVILPFQSRINNVYRSTVHFEIYSVHTPTNALFINLVRSFKFTLKYTIISLLHVSVFNDHHQGALSVPN